MEYIQTKARLEQVAVMQLGLMTEGTYDSFMSRARASGLARPALMIEFTFKIGNPMGYQAGAQAVYPISKGEWADFINDIPTYCTYPPNVYVVDGSLYTAPI